VVLGERRTGEKGSSSSPLLRLFLSSFNVIANMMKKARADSFKGERERPLSFFDIFLSLCVREKERGRRKTKTGTFLNFEFRTTEEKK
tara:strand:- start:103 stop:366 length:264 start_codon:yes stop_codon:yes gene_type:complete